MDNKTKRIFKPLEDIPGWEHESRSIELVKALTRKALQEQMWIFDPQFKKWQTPEDFRNVYERHMNIDRHWIDRLEIRDPAEGLQAADHQIESIMSRKMVLAQRIIDYWKNKKTA